MYLLDTKSMSCFFAGDTALTGDSDRLVRERLQDAGRRLDVALLPIGHAPWWKRESFRRGHLTTEDALVAILEQFDRALEINSGRKTACRPAREGGNREVH